MKSTWFEYDLRGFSVNPLKLIEINQDRGRHDGVLTERSSSGFYTNDQWWAVQDSNLRPPACKAGALTS